MSSSLKTMRSTMAEVLAMAVLDQFPGTELRESSVSNVGFKYCFKFLQPVHPELIPLLEERMRAILKAKPAMESIEMTAWNAAEYFRHHGQEWKAEQALNAGAEVLSLMRSSSFYDIPAAAWEPLEQDVQFKLLDTKILEGNYVVVEGTAFLSKEELKEFVKRRKEWLKERPWEKAYQLGWLADVDSQTVLLPEGAEVWRKLVRFWRGRIQEQGFAEVALFENDDAMARVALSQRLKRDLAEWTPAWIAQCHRYCPRNQAVETCISSLQFISQTFNMLELNANWVLCNQRAQGVQTKEWRQEVKCLTAALERSGFAYSVDSDKAISGAPVIELRITDSIGETWAGPFLSVNLGSLNPKFPQSLAAVDYSLLGSTKRLIALLAELKAGRLPACLS